MRQELFQKKPVHWGARVAESYLIRRNWLNDSIMAYLRPHGYGATIAHWTESPTFCCWHQVEKSTQVLGMWGAEPSVRSVFVCLTDKYRWLRGSRTLLGQWLFVWRKRHLFWFRLLKTFKWAEIWGAVAFCPPISTTLRFVLRPSTSSIYFFWILVLLNWNCPPNYFSFHSCAHRCARSYGLQTEHLFHKRPKFLKIPRWTRDFCSFRKRWFWKNSFQSRRPVIIWVNTRTSSWFHISPSSHFIFSTRRYQMANTLQCR